MGEAQFNDPTYPNKEDIWLKKENLAKLLASLLNLLLVRQKHDADDVLQLASSSP
jgi:hypothetical protein